MAGPWNPPQSPRRAPLTNVTFQTDDSGTNLNQDQTSIRRPPDRTTMSRPLSNITEVTSQAAEDTLNRKDNLQPLQAAGALSEKSYIPKNPQAKDSQASIDKYQLPFRDSSQRNRHANLLAQIDASLHPDLSPSKSSGTTTLTPPDDSAAPLMASSGRVGTLHLRVHRHGSRPSFFGQLSIVGALSHQTWVSGEVLLLGVEIYNSSERFLKRIDLQLERLTMMHSHGPSSAAVMKAPVESRSETLAKWSWKKGLDGWKGVASHTQVGRFWDPIVPAGQATMNTHRFEVCYSLVVSIPGMFGKAASTQIPLTIVNPNSLGAGRLQQRLRHAFRSQNSDHDGSELPFGRYYSNKMRASQDRNRSSAENRHGDKPKRIYGTHDYVPDENSVFMTSNPVPRVSDELLSEMLQKLPTSQCKSPRKHTLPHGTRHRGHQSAPGHFVPVLKPLAAIGAHCRRKSSDDVRKSINGQYLSSNLLVPPQLPVARASFDDYLRPRHQRGSGKDLVPQRQQENQYSGSSGFWSTSSFDTEDMERFLKERQSFNAIRRASANPFFKGSANKERLRSAKYGYQTLKNIQASYDAAARNNRDYRPAINCDVPSYKGRLGRKTSKTREAQWKYGGMRTLF